MSVITWRISWIMDSLIASKVHSLWTVSAVFDPWWKAPPTWEQRKKWGHHQNCYLEDNREEWEKNGRQEAEKLVFGSDGCVPLNSRKELDEKGEYSIHLVILVIWFGQRTCGVCGVCTISFRLYPLSKVFQKKETVGCQGKCCKCRKEQSGEESRQFEVFGTFPLV